MKNVRNFLIYTILAAVSVTSCSIDDRGWDSYGTEGYDYLKYPDEVMENVVKDAVTLLDYMVKVESLVENPVPDQLYRVPDGNGDYVCVLHCEVEGSDTIWVLNNSKYRVSRKDDTWWVSYGNKATYVEATDDYSYFNYFQYDYTMSATMGTITDEEVCRYPWEVTLTGTRTERSDYSMSFSIDSSMKIEWEEQGSYSSGQMLPSGELDIKFFKGEEELDYLNTIYSGGVVTYSTSLQTGGYHIE